MSRFKGLGGVSLWLEYGVLTLAIILPLLAPGYILTLDLVFAPHMPPPTSVDNGFLFQWIIHLATNLFPSQMVEKILLLLVLLLSGVGAHRLMLALIRRRYQSGRAWGAYFAGVLYMINPFVYTRFMVGQILVLLGYALLPWVARSLFDFVAQPSRRQALRLSAWLVVLSLISIHIFYMAGVLTVVALAVAMYLPERSVGYRRQLGKCFGLTAVLVLAASAYWLWFMVSGHGTTSQLIQSFDSNSFLSFATVPDPQWGALLNVAALYGFWGDSDGIGRYILPKNIMPLWPLMFLAIFGLVLVGLRKWSQREPIIVISLAITGVVAWILALGVAHPMTAVIYTFLFEHLPLFQGFREPQKFAGLLVLSYAVLGGLGVQSLVAALEQQKGSFTRKVARFAPAFLILLPILYTPTMLWGFHNQLTPVNYPASWYALNRQLNQDSQQFKVLFLPWHQYMGFHFGPRVIYNPAASFFDKPIIASDDAEFGKVRRQLANPTNEAIERDVLSQPELTNAGERLTSHRIKYIILVKEYDFDKYRYLDHQSDLQLLGETPEYRLYLNQRFQQ